MKLRTVPVPVRYRSLLWLKLIIFPGYFVLNYCYSKNTRIGVKKSFHTGNTVEARCDRSSLRLYKKGGHRITSKQWKAIILRLYYNVKYNRVAEQMYPLANLALIFGSDNLAKFTDIKNNRFAIDRSIVNGVSAYILR